MVIYEKSTPIGNIKVKAKVAQLCLTLHDPMDYTVQRILQVRILEWVVVPVSRGFFQPRDCITGGFFTSWATREAQKCWSGLLIPSPADLPDTGIKVGYPALQADSLPTELSEKSSNLMVKNWKLFLEDQKQQGCLLSPFLFKILLKALARAIRQYKEIKGIKLERKK